MVNATLKTNHPLTGGTEELAYVYENFGNVSGWHARIGHGSTIGQPCAVKEEAALYVARELKKQGWMPPSIAEMTLYQEKIDARLKLPTEWRPDHPQAEKLTLELAPNTGSGYKHVSYRPDSKKMVAAGKPYVPTLKGYPSKCLSGGPETAWYVAYCKKHGVAPPHKFFG